MSVLFEDLFAELNQDPEVRVAGDEYRLRRELAAILDKRRAEKGLTLRAMAERMDTSLSQVQRLFQEEHGGSLTLRTIVKAAMALDLKIGIEDSGNGDIRVVCGENVPTRVDVSKSVLSAWVRLAAKQCVGTATWRGELDVPVIVPGLRDSVLVPASDSNRLPC